jgi:4-hydroxy-tetrahydrodipicolinate reductase
VFLPNWIANPIQQVGYLCLVKIAIIGYGKMGREIESIALERGHEIAQSFDSARPLCAEDLSNCDIAIEFSRPEMAAQHIMICASAGIPVVVGTTGWYEKYDEVVAAVTAHNTAMLCATNFSLGVNITFFLNEVLARIMNNYSEYQTGITEIHHTKKLDSPSGTAITLAEGILNSHAAFESWKLEAGESSGPTLPIEAIREAEVPGTHIVRYNSPIDSIEIKHTAHNRRGFALGAVVAAEWTANKNGIFGMKDMLNFEALIH